MRTFFFVVALTGAMTPPVPAQSPKNNDEPTPPRATNSPYGGTSYSRGGMGGGGGRGGGFGGFGMMSDSNATQQLMEQWKAASEPSERDKVEKTLRESLTMEFAERLAAHEREIKELEEKVRQLRNRLNLRREKQDEIVEHRLQQILREAQGLGWGSEEVSAYGGRGGYGGTMFGGRGYGTSKPAPARLAPSGFAPSADRAKDAGDSALNEVEGASRN